MPTEGRPAWPKADEPCKACDMPAYAHGALTGGQGGGRACAAFLPAAEIGTKRLDQVAAPAMPPAGFRAYELTAEHFEAMAAAREERDAREKAAVAPIPVVLTCPACSARHIDEGEFATKPHHTHACQECGLTWRPAVVATVGVRFLPGFKDGGGV